MMGEMYEAIQTLKDQPSVRVLIIDAVDGSKAFLALYSKNSSPL
jgi:hypothetical protein